MKKLLFIALCLLLSLSLFATTFSGLGFSGLYDDPLDTFELGFYSTYSYTYPIDGTAIEIGMGTRADFSLSLPLHAFTLGIMPGMNIVAPLSNRIDFSALIGPGVFVIMPDDSPSLIGLGGGLDLALTFYLDSAKSVGLTVGSANYFAAVFGASFGYYGGGYFGFSVRIPNNDTPLPSGYSYIEY